jgi:hypothetical protein
MGRSFRAPRYDGRLGCRSRPSISRGATFSVGWGADDGAGSASRRALSAGNKDDGANFFVSVSCAPVTGRELGIVLKRGECHKRVVDGTTGDFQLPEH